MTGPEALTLVCSLFSQIDSFMDIGFVLSPASLLHNFLLPHLDSNNLILLLLSFSLFFYLSLYLKSLFTLRSK